jgi:hypothetical protein
MIQVHSEQGDSRKRWLKLSGGGALVFFLVKGIVWLAIAAAAGIGAWTR